MKRIVNILIAGAIITGCAVENQDDSQEQKEVVVTEESNNIELETENNESMETLHNFKVATLMGEEFDLAQLKGKKVMIVNVASECGLTPQYKNLQELYNEYGGENFEIVAFPANNFGAQEPGTNEEIAQFCEANYGVTFPVMSKVSVKDSNVAEVYQFLTQKEKNGVEDVEMIWNFQKILVDENGAFVKSVHPQTLPTEPEIIDWING